MATIYDWKSYPLSTMSEEVNENFKKLAKQRVKPAFDYNLTIKNASAHGKLIAPPPLTLAEKIIVKIIPYLPYFLLWLVFMALFNIMR